jgi:hypothetical protein
MNLWIIKNIKFGYRYTTNRSIRKNIHEYFDNYLLNILSTKGSSNDKLIIVGGVFSNTNPSIIAISDAIKYITKISNLMKVILISTPNDIRFFDGTNYSTLDLFKNIDNVEIKSYNKDDFISYGECVIDIENSIININGDKIDIPNIIQFDDNDEDKTGIFVNRLSDNKYTILNNKFSPKHVTYEINTFEDFNNIEKDNNIIHLEIFKLIPSSVKYKNEKNIKNIKLVEDFDIINKIYDTIGQDDEVKKQFNRILDINNKNT